MCELCDRIEAEIEEWREEAARDGLVYAKHAAVVACKCLALQIGDLLLDPPRGLKWAVFGDGGEKQGGISLVIRSSRSDRRVDFVIAPDGRSVSIVGIGRKAQIKWPAVMSVLNLGLIHKTIAWAAGDKEENSL